MRTKVILCLAVGCLLSALVGGVVTNSLKAQAQPQPYPTINGWPFSVNFVEDPFRMHGLMVKNYYSEKSGFTWHSI